MNLFCFTLEGSTESIYQPAYSQTLKEVLPKYQCSPALLRRKVEWGGSDPSINSNRPQSATKSKRDNRRSCVPTSALEKEILERDINHTCWMSPGDKKDLFCQKKVQKRETCRASSQSSKQTRDDKVKEVSSDRTQTDQPAQAVQTAAAEPVQTTGRLKKLQNLVQAKKTHQTGAGKEKSTSEHNNHLADMVSNDKPVLTCIALRRRSEKKSSKTATSPQQLQHQLARSPHEDPQEEGAWSPQPGADLWSPFECPQPWSPFYHTCHQPRHEPWAVGGTLSLPRTTEWDRFENLIQELDSKQSAPSPMIRSITDLHLSQNRLARCGRLDTLRQNSPLIKPQDNGSSLQKQERGVEPTKVWLPRREMETSLRSDKKHVKASPEKTLTALIKRDVQKDEAQKREPDRGRPLTKEHRRSSNSLESLYSHNSGQSSSSGVTSGSDCSSNRDSLRLDDELLYTRQLCGRARVHTEYVPSPYDTESLKLKVGDVIEIIAKPSMGIWTGMLNGKIGNFKFIYVDVLTEETHEDTEVHEVRHKSTVREVLKRLSLEEYSSSLQLHGYQTVDDLMGLREHHLTELNVTDPEHRQRLLAAVDSLQQLGSDSQLENEASREVEASSESGKADMNNCPRDSGCHIMPFDSPDSSTVEADLHL